MQEAPAEGRCRYCGTALEQPASGGRQKLFCGDDHRLRYWRERRRQGLPTGAEAEERHADAQTLSWELQATLLGFERTVGTLSSVLAQAGDLDAARAIREQAQAEAQRRVAAADERRARADGMRLEAEAMAEAASAAANQSQERLQEMEGRVTRAEAEVEAAGADAARVREVALAEGRRLAEVQEGLRTRIQVLDRELEGRRQRGERLERHLQEMEAAHRRETCEQADRLEALHSLLRVTEAGLAAEREARLRAEAQAEAAGALADERAKERDRALRAARHERARSARTRARPGGPSR